MTSLSDKYEMLSSKVFTKNKIEWTSLIGLPKKLENLWNINHLLKPWKDICKKGESKQTNSLKSLFTAF